MCNLSRSGGLLLPRRVNTWRGKSDHIKDPRNIKENQLHLLSRLKEATFLGVSKENSVQFARREPGKGSLLQER